MIEWLGPHAGWLALALLGVMLAVFATERFPPEMVAIGAVAVFLVLGLLDSSSMVGALANAAPLTIACMFVISAALVRTGRSSRSAGLSSEPQGRAGFWSSASPSPSPSWCRRS